MISLIIPCFNEEENLKKLFDKLALMLNENSDENIEIIIVDNGSTDGSNKLIRENKLFLSNKLKLLNIKKISDTETESIKASILLRGI